MSLSIARWRNRFHSPQILSAQQLRVWHEGLDELRDTPGPVHDSEELICVRRLQLRGRLQAEDGSAQALAMFRAALQEALDAALHGSGAQNHVLRYPQRRAALADLLYRLAAGERERLWAWQQLRLLPAWAERSSLSELREAAVQSLAREAQLIWPVLMHLLQAQLQSGAFALLLRAYTAAQWQQLLAACPQSRAYLQPPGKTQPQTAQPLPQTAELLWLLQLLRAQPQLMAQRRDSLLVLLAACAQPAPQHPPTQQRILQAAAAQLQAMAPQPPASGTRLSARSQPQLSTAAATPSATKPAAADSRSAEAARPPRAAPELPQAALSQHSAQAGLLFLLNLLPAAGLLDCASLREGSWHAPQLLRRLALEHLQISAQDAALRAFCGGWLPAAADEDHEPLSEAQHADLQALHARLLALLRQALHWQAPEPPLLPWLLHRHAEIVFEPGWIEVHLAARDAEVRIRRAALDLDPGYLPWLGCVLRFVYD